MPTLTTELYQSLMDALVARCDASGESVRHFVTQALSDALGLDHATLFQVSTGAALVQGVHDKAVTVGDLRSHGDFGLGTFEGLDGEMVVLDGRFYQAHQDGRITVAPDAAAVPFAALTTFRALHRAALTDIGSIGELTTVLDRMRRSPNLFFAVRIDGTFSALHMRVACKVPPGTPLTEATAHQAEFHLAERPGTIVGFWSPPFSRMVTVAGWHLHFLSEDRTTGGHVLDCRATHLEAQVQDIDDLRLAMPETPRFLQADLTGDPTVALDKAERLSNRPVGTR